jgi:hypothetical protein
MAVQNDDVDTGLLATIGLAGAALVIAGAYFAAGIYWEHVKATAIERSIAPAIEQTRAARDAELAALEAGALPIGSAKQRVADKYR